MALLNWDDADADLSQMVVDFAVDCSDRDWLTEMKRSTIWASGEGDRRRRRRNSVSTYTTLQQQGQQQGETETTATVVLTVRRTWA